MSNKNRLYLLGMILVILTALFLCWGVKAGNWEFALSRRIPKVAAILLTAAAIAYSSLIFQTISNNRILTPSVLGLDSLYLFIQTLVVFVYGSHNEAIKNNQLNFLITVAVMLLVTVLLFRALFRKTSNNIYLLLLVGFIFGTFFQSASSFMQAVMDPNEFSIVQNKMFASFNNINTGILLTAALLCILAAVYSRIYGRMLDVISLGRDQAISLGVDYDKTAMQIFATVAILVSVSTALVGPIVFLGLLAVNLAREYVDTYRHSYLITASVLISGIALTGGQLLAERIFNFKTPISVIINFVGGIYFIYLLLKEKK
jgi:iron complex transport system permease protein